MLEIKRILCPIDFSEFSIRAYDHALSMAEHYRAKVVALHVIELSHYPYADYAASAGDYENFCHAMREGGKEQLREFVKKARPGRNSAGARGAPGNRAGLYSEVRASAESGPDRHGNARPARV